MLSLIDLRLPELLPFSASRALTLCKQCKYLIPVQHDEEKKQITGGVSSPCFDSRRLGVCLALPLSDDLADLPVRLRFRATSASDSRSDSDPDLESGDSSASTYSDPEPDAILHSQCMSRFTKTRKTGRRLAVSLLLAACVHLVRTFTIHRGFCTPYARLDAIPCLVRNALLKLSRSVQVQCSMACPVRELMQRPHSIKVFFVLAPQLLLRTC